MAVKTIGPGAKNRLRKTNDFTIGATWTQNSPLGTITSGGSNNPFTGTTAGVYTLNDNTTTTNTWAVRQTTTASTTNPQPINTTNLVANRLYTYSIYVKQGTAAKTLINVTHNNTEGKAGVLITWPTGTSPIVLTSKHTAHPTEAIYTYRNYNVTKVGTDGWYRVSCTIPWIPSGGNTALRIQILPAGEVIADTGSIYVYGPQFEEGQAATEYQEITTDTDPLVCDYRTIEEWLAATQTAVPSTVDEGQLCGEKFVVVGNALNFNRSGNNSTTYRKLTTGTLNGTNFKYNPIDNTGARITVLYAVSGTNYGINVTEDFTVLSNFGLFVDFQTRPDSGTNDMIRVDKGSDCKFINLFLSCEVGGEVMVDDIDFQGIRFVGASGDLAQRNTLFNCIVRGAGNLNTSPSIAACYYWDLFSELGGAYNCVAYGANSVTGLGFYFPATTRSNGPEIVNCISTEIRGACFTGLCTKFDNNISGDATAVTAGIDNTSSLVDAGSKGRISANNLFVNAEGNDFRLRAGSVAIDAGSNQNTVFTGSSGPGNNNDFNNVTRTGKTWDIGAYEGATVVSTSPATVITKTVGRDITRDYPNIAAFVRNLPKSLSYANESWVAVCYDDGEEILGEPIKIDYIDCRTDIGHTIEIKGATVYDPKLRTGPRTSVISDYSTRTYDRALIWVTARYTKLKNLYLANKSTSALSRNVGVVECFADYMQVDGVYGEISGTIAPNSCAIFDIRGSYTTWQNCIARGSDTTGTGATFGFRVIARTTGTQILHCNAYRIKGGSVASSSNSHGFFVAGNWRFTRVSGCIAIETNTAGSGSKLDFSVGQEISGLITDGNAEAVVLDRCISSDASAVGYKSIASQTAAAVWNNAPNGDFRLKVGSPAANAGGNLTNLFSTDYFRNPRENPFDIGAVEGVVYAPLLRTPRPRDAHRYCSVYNIIRKDGVSYRFCTTNEPIVFKGLTYVPTGGTSGSAKRLEAGLKAHNMEIRGAISSTVISNTDLAAGLFNGASVTEHVIDWRYPFTEPYTTKHYTIAQINYNQDSWSAELVGDTYLLERRTGELVTKGCPYQLGDQDCQVILQIITQYNRTVSTVASENKRQFTASGITSTSDDYFGAGKVIWITGNNSGVESEVKSYINSSRTVRLRFETPYPIQVNDTFTIVPGCRKRYQTDCIDKFDNGINFGGRPHIPGTDKSLDTPTR